jgi:HD-GYP domain-containing protein (c-di-GMP phosphodiesterase class II)
MSENDARDARRLELGRDLLARWAALFKALRLYDWQHSGVTSFAERVRETVRDLCEDSTGVDLAVRGDSIYLDGVRLREGGPTASVYRRLVRLLDGAQVAGFGTDSDAELRDVQLFAHLVLAVFEGRSTREEMAQELKVRGVTGVSVTLREKEDEAPRMVEGHELQKRIYLASISVLKGTFHEARAKDRINSRRVKRVVQQMMESLESDPAYLLNLTSVKNYDEYTFNHSVNVGVLAIALGRSVGLSRRQLYVVGQAGMLHDLGKLCVPKEILNKRGRLTPDERDTVQSHPTEGFFKIASKQGVSPDTIGVALGAYEHHLNLDGTGYPSPAVTRPIGLLSRILAIVDRYDAMTSVRVYRSLPIPPPKALSILFHSQKAHVDQALLRYFMNMMGTYPLGSTVRLSDNSVAIVVGSGSVVELPHFPRVTIVLDELGHPGSEEEIDLSVTAKEPGALQVIETLDAADYGIEPMDYLV